MNGERLEVRKKEKLLCCPHPTKIWKLGRSVGIFFLFFFLRTVRELSFPIFFLKFLNGENSGRMQSKRIYTSHAIAFLSHWIQILANSSPKSDIKKKKKKKKNPTLFFRILRSVGRGQHKKKKNFGIMNSTWIFEWPFLWGYIIWKSLCGQSSNFGMQWKKLANDASNTKVTIHW